MDKKFNVAGKEWKQEIKIQVIASRRHNYQESMFIYVTNVTV